MATQVFDLSSNNHHPITVADFYAAKHSGRSAAIIKLTQGGGADSYINPFAAQDIANAKAAGLIVAGYHFMIPTIPIPEQVALVKSHLDNLGFVWVDSETAEASWTAEGSATHSMIEGLQPFVKSGLYSNPNFLENMPGAPWGDLLWLAEYGPKASFKYNLWQFTDHGTVPGLEGPIDLSVFNGTIPQLAALFAKKAAQETKQWLKVKVQLPTGD